MKVHLDSARRDKHDEFYTLYADVEAEVQHYAQHLKGKIVYCNCDSLESNFVKYFQDNFTKLGLKALWAGITQPKQFNTPVGLLSVGRCGWYTNLAADACRPALIPTVRYTGQYRRYDNCDAVHVPSLADIPNDYDGVMGVPLTLALRDYERLFDVVGFRVGDDGQDLRLDGKSVFARLLVKRRAT